MLSLNLQDFVQELKSRGGQVGFWNDGKALQASHPEFQELAKSVQGLADFKNHEAFFLKVGERSGHLHSVFLHKTERGPGAGGVRRKVYDSLGAQIEDGLRLAIGMGYKNALADLWWGGGKGVIGVTGDADRQAVYQEFGEFNSSLNGCYVTAEDVGTKPEDMATVFSRTRFTTCIPAQFGGSGNPSPATARGVFVGVEASLKFLGLSDWSKAKIAVQGLGEVGLRLAKHLHDRGASLVVFDPEDSKVKEVLAWDERHRASTMTTILEEEVDVLCPCALGAILNPESIAKLRCRAICGAANNQLADSKRDSQALHTQGVVYVPDFVVNRMGIVNCADEQYGRLQPDPAVERHLDWQWEQAIGPVVLNLLKRSQRSGNPPLLEAAKKAEELMKKTHPMWPGRARQIAHHSWLEMRP